jgi:hypothetical protein
MILLAISQETEGFVRGMERRAVLTRWVGSVKKCLAMSLCMHVSAAELELGSGTREWLMILTYLTSWEAVRKIKEECRVEKDSIGTVSIEEQLHALPCVRPLGRPLDLYRWCGVAMRGRWGLFKLIFERLRSDASDFGIRQEKQIDKKTISHIKRCSHGRVSVMNAMPLPAPACLIVTNLPGKLRQASDMVTAA